MKITVKEATIGQIVALGDTLIAFMKLSENNVDEMSAIQELVNQMPECLSIVEEMCNITYMDNAKKVYLTNLGITDLMVVIDALKTVNSDFLVVMERLGKKTSIEVPQATE